MEQQFPQFVDEMRSSRQQIAQADQMAHVKVTRARQNKQRVLEFQKEVSIECDEIRLRVLAI